jgi:hypothetical protein
VTQIGSDGPRTKVHSLPDDRIAAVAQMANAGVGQDDRVLDLDRLSDVTSVTDARVASQVAVGADLAVASDDHFALDIDSGQDVTALAQGDEALHNCPFA